MRNVFKAIILLAAAVQPVVVFARPTAVPNDVLRRDTASSTTATTSNTGANAGTTTTTSNSGTNSGTTVSASGTVTRPPPKTIAPRPVPVGAKAPPILPSLPTPPGLQTGTTVTVGGTTVTAGATSNGGTTAANGGAATPAGDGMTVATTNGASTSTTTSTTTNNANANTSANTNTNTK